MNNNQNGNQLKIDYLIKELENVTQRLDEQIKINESYSNLMNGRTDMKMLLTVMQQEQITLKSRIEKLVEERNESIAKNLILDQIVNASHQEIQYIQMESEQIIKQQQEQIRQYENSVKSDVKIDCENSGYIIKYKIITNVNEITLKMNQQLEQLNQRLVEQSKLILKLQESKNDLIQLNFTLSNELCKKRLITQQTQQVNIDKYMANIIEAQNKLIMLDRDDSDKDCLSPMEDKVQTIKQKPYFKGDSEDIKQVPKLDLKKAQQIQQYNMQQLQLKALNNANLSPSEEIQKYIYIYELMIRWMNEFKNLKNHYDSQRIINNQLVMQLEELDRKIQDLLNHNQILINSNKNYEQKWKSIQNAYAYYQQFYLENKEILMNKSQNRTSKIQESASDMRQFIQQSTEIKVNPQNCETQSNYKDKVMSLTKDVMSIFRRHKPNQKDSNNDDDNDENIPHIQDLKREMRNCIGPLNKQR